MCYKTIWKEEGVIFDFYNVITAEEVLQAFTSIFGDIRFEIIKYKIVNFINVKINLMSLQEAKILGVLDQKASIWNPKLFVSIITHDEYNTFLMKEYLKQLESTEWSYEIFNHRKDVSNYLEENVL